MKQWQRFSRPTEMPDPHEDLLRGVRKLERAHNEAVGRAVLGGRTLKEGEFAEAILEGATLFVGKGIWKAITGETVEGDHIIVGGVRIRLWSCLADDAMIALKMPDFGIDLPMTQNPGA